MSTTATLAELASFEGEELGTSDGVARSVRR
jgi:hypothetical protein